MKYSLLRYCLVLVLYGAFEGRTQVHDFGLWTGINIEKKLNKDLSFTLREEVRTFENFSTVSNVLSQVGFSYDLHKRITVKGAYRYSMKNGTVYNGGHRYQLDGVYTYKKKPFVFQYRVRYQKGYNDLYRVENRYSPKTQIRNRLMIKYKLNKKVRFYGGTELFTGFANYQAYLNDIRFVGGAKLAVTKDTHVKVGGLYQRSWYSSAPVWHEYNFILAYFIRL